MCVYERRDDGESGKVGTKGRDNDVSTLRPDRLSSSSFPRTWHHSVHLLHSWSSSSSLPPSQEEWDRHRRRQSCLSPESTSGRRSDKRWPFVSENSRKRESERHEFVATDAGGKTEKDRPPAQSLRLMRKRGERERRQSRGYKTGEEKRRTDRRGRQVIGGRQQVADLMRRESE